MYFHCRGSADCRMTSDRDNGWPHRTDTACVSKLKYDIRNSLQSHYINLYAFFKWILSILTQTTTLAGTALLELGAVVAKKSQEEFAQVLPICRFKIWGITH